MNNKRLISLTICLILATVPGISSLILADTVPKTDTKAQDHFEKANELRKLADYEAAIAEYKKVVSLSPKSRIAQDAQYWIGQSYFEAGQFDAALSAFEKLLDEYPASTIIPSTKLMIQRVQQTKKTKSLHEATIKGDIAGIKWLISIGADVNARDQNGRTPLYYAVNSDRKEVAELLIAKGADVNAIEDSFWGETPLFFMVRDHRELAELLIANGADVNAKSHIGWTPLHEAAWDGYRHVAELLLAKGADVSAKVEYFVPLHTYTPLHIAAHRGHKDVVELLLAKGSHVSNIHRAAYIGDLKQVKTSIAEGTDINVRDECEWTPLLWACRGHQKDVAAFLIAKGADVNVRDQSGMTLLDLAAKEGLADIAAILINKGADIHARNEDIYGGTPLHTAAYNGRADVAELLLAEGADVNARQRTGHTPLEHAAWQGHLDVVELLISRGANIDAGDNWGTTPLGAAVSYNRPEAVKLLLKRGAYVDGRDHYDYTSLHRAVIEGNEDMVELLLTHGASPWRRRIGLDLVGIAMQGNQKEMVRFLIDRGFEHSAVHVAAFLGDLDEVKRYLAAGGDINAMDRSRLTLLVCAIFGEQAAEVEFLISKGADINLKGAIGKTALHWAIQRFRPEIAGVLLEKRDRHRPEIARMLLEKGADVTIRDDFGCTVLYWAAYAGYKDTVATILAKGADVNAKSGVFTAPEGISDSGWTPLHGACVAARIETRRAVAEVLIANGADVNIKTKNGKTPISLVKGRDYGRVVELLRKHGAKE